MRALLFGPRMSQLKIQEIVRKIGEVGISPRLVKEFDEDSLQGEDFVLVFGGDGDVLRVIQMMGEKTIPVLGLSQTNETGFLIDTIMSEMEQAIRQLSKGDYGVEEASRISVTVDGGNTYFALNEVAVFPSRSATLLEYTLTIDGEFVWRDYSDGVMVSTPTGSTAYAMSAGGPMVLPNTPAFAVVPVNSMDVTRRPLIASDASTIEISDINCRYECQAVVDGTFRIKLKDHAKAKKAISPAKIVRLFRESPTMERISRKVRLAQELLDMPPSAKLVLKTLQYEGPLTQRSLMEKTILPGRTTRMALALLIRRGLVRTKTSLRDARQKVYHPS